MEIAALRLISVLGCEPNIDVLARKVTWPVSWLQPQSLYTRRF